MTNNSMYEEKLILIKQALGERYVLHPKYKPLPYHSTTYRSSYFLSAIKEKAIKEGRLTA